MLNLTFPGYLAVDGGAYLESVRDVLGLPSAQIDFTRPPLAPGWLLVPFVGLWEPENGLKIWSALASTLPLIPTWLLARKLHPNPWAAVFAVGFMALDPLQAEGIVFGALSIIAFALLGMVWWAMLELVERWRWPQAGILTICLGLIPWVNQSTSGLALITVPVLILAMLAYNGWNPRLVLRLAPPLLLGGLIALLALPWYVDVAPGSGMVRYPGPLVYLRLDGIYLVMFPSAMVTYLILKDRAAAAGHKALAVVLASLCLLSIWYSTNEAIINVFFKSNYLASLLFYPLAAYLVFYYAIPALRQRRYGHAVPIGIVLAAVYMLTIALYAFYSTAQRQQQVTPATAQALQYIDGDGIIITNNQSMSLWVAGLTGTGGYWVFRHQPPERYALSDQHVRCLLNWLPDCDVPAAARATGVSYVLLDTRFPPGSPYLYGAPADYLAPVLAAPWLEMIYQEQTTYLWRVRHGS